MPLHTLVALLGCPLTADPASHAPPGLVVTSALIIWKSLMLVTGSESPVVVVLSGSMEPGFHRGDILFLNLGKAPARTGEIVVFNLDGRDIPIVHRVIKVHERAGGEHLDILTKVRRAAGG